ncbi:endonuclease/exonuclease/phosphatase family protein [Corallococcus sp. H22C18031201]|uniref:endonuclease/exonuclease/phosphatase family protein n=1 Tax=Citreicoccus inhibens TaxID=2849499 RepID=UPI000E736721|nr:endonuclease/exonuclease/phosphatase family protein [Citreicoccus inhibens]MBU8895266.1 endonuclease/exonuclease/phosphatase family protein [Citreicoccus inhibens]RJS26166.1 endonuclease/exonuclease/phosphatase family protein [Corallococcus sp. H22C18031201]
MKVPELLEHLPAVGPRLARGTEEWPRREETLGFTDFTALPRPSGERRLGDGRTLVVRHPAVTPPRGPGLTVMSYNILLGGLYREPLLAYFAQLEKAGRMPDVIGLQEASVPMAALLASRFGFHLAYQGNDGGSAARLVNGKALLSRHPLRDAAHFTYVIADAERDAAIARQGEPGELVEDRGVLWARIDVAGRSVSLYNLHHALGDSGINAHNLRQLNVLLRHREDADAVVLGDFNANTAIKRGGSWLWAHWGAYDDTDTVEEYRARYGTPRATVGDWGVGNIADPRLRHALHHLEHALPETIAHAAQVHVRLADGSVMTPHAAREALRSGHVARGGQEWLRLQDVADCATLSSLPDEAGLVPATGKRFDNFYASPSLEPVLFEVDRSTESSDHQPVLSHYRLREAASAPSGRH